MPQNTTPCQSCRAWSQPPDDRMSALGFGRCAHLPPYRYTSGGTTCALNPGRFAPKGQSHG